MRVLYEPKGRALEYSPLAVNLFDGCRHGCLYCYVPGIFRTNVTRWAENPQPKPNVLAWLQRDCRRMEGDPREILLCFTCDPYQSAAAADLTRAALEILEKHRMRVTILTKAGQRAERDFDILQRNGWKFGSTISFLSEKIRENWEPGAPSIGSRLAAVRKAHAEGIFTWISVEPVLYPDQAMKAMEALLPWADFFKVGKLNHLPLLEKGIDWRAFLRKVRDLVPPEKLYVKRDLLRFGIDDLP